MTDAVLISAEIRIPLQLHEAEKKLFALDTDLVLRNAIIDMLIEHYHIAENQAEHYIHDITVRRGTI